MAMNGAAAVCCAAVILAAPAVRAHQPHFVRDTARVVVNDPEVSKAYYGELVGSPASYHIKTTAPFDMYVAILVPDIPGVDTDYTVQIYRYEDHIATLSGPEHEWKRFFEPFGGDRYLRGPEFRESVRNGRYEIYVWSPDNRGKYVLVIGEKEEWPRSEIRRTLAVMPQLKREFFGTSPWTGLISFFGLALILVVAAAAAIVIAAVRAARRAAANSKH